MTATGCAALVSTLTLTGCVETRVVRSNELLAGLPGAEGGVQVDEPDPAAGRSWEQLLSRFDDGTDQGGVEWKPIDGSHLRVETETGQIRLISKSPSHVMYHLTQTLLNDELELLVDQVLSERTKRVYEDRGLDPMEAAVYLKRNRDQISKLFAALPLGEQTPGVLMKGLGDNAFRLRAPPALIPELKFHYFDVVIEHGSFRLLRIAR